jgi:hypothetical protein
MAKSSSPTKSSVRREMLLLDEPINDKYFQSSIGNIDRPTFWAFIEQIAPYFRLNHNCIKHMQSCLFSPNKGELITLAYKEAKIAQMNKMKEEIAELCGTIEGRFKETFAQIAADMTNADRLVYTCDFLIKSWSGFKIFAYHLTYLSGQDSVEDLRKSYADEYGAMIKRLTVPMPNNLPFSPPESLRCPSHMIFWFKQYFSTFEWQQKSSSDGHRDSSFYCLQLIGSPAENPTEIRDLMFEIAQDDTGLPVFRLADMQLQQICAFPDAPDSIHMRFYDSADLQTFSYKVKCLGNPHFDAFMRHVREMETEAEATTEAEVPANE